ncbi:hypothetical protein AMTRI_Chr03g138650 [Amborella trichopoda]
MPYSNECSLAKKYPIPQTKIKDISTSFFLFLPHQIRKFMHDIENPQGMPISFSLISLLCRCSLSGSLFSSLLSSITSSSLLLFFSLANLTFLYFQLSFSLLYISFSL